jgi:predicted DsbA family dithiol-disulfide isomerase
VWDVSLTIRLTWFHRRERYAAKFGDKVDAITAMMAERGKPWGINFSYGGTIRNTFLSHRLIEKAWEEGGETMQTRLVEKLFAGYFEQEKDIGDPAWLAEVAVASDVFTKKEDAIEFLESDELKKETCNEVRQAQSLGISGVPFTVINNKYAVSGAQEPEAFVTVFRKIACGQSPCKQAS